MKATPEPPEAGIEAVIAQLHSSLTHLIWANRIECRFLLEQPSFVLAAKAVPLTCELLRKTALRISHDTSMGRHHKPGKKLRGNSTVSPPESETTLAVCELRPECQNFEEATELTEACGVSCGWRG